MVRFTLKQCAYFTAVVEHGGIAQAGRALNISQPAIAQAIDKLEDFYGFRLLRRHHARGTELTPEGRSFLGLAKDMVDRAEAAERKAHAIASTTSGTILFGCFHTLAPFYLSQIVRAHAAHRPNVEVLPSEHAQDEITSALAAGKLDLALTYDMSLDESTLDWIEIDRLDPFVILRRDHPMAKRRSIRLSDLADEPFVLFDGAGSTDYFKGMIERGGNRTRIAHHARSMESVRCAVGNGLGISLTVMRTKTNETYDGGAITYVPISDDVAALPIVIAFKKDTERNGLLNDLVATCQTEIQRYNRAMGSVRAPAKKGRPRAQKSRGAQG